MPRPDQTSKLPKWPFLVGDAVLLGAAWLIADGSPRPFSPELMIAIAASVIAATVIGVIPFLSDYARRQDEALDERQRALESLAQTVSTAAEQIGIAARGFQEIAELEQRNLKEAEKLPQKLQDKLAELQTRRSAARDDEKEELKKELAARRTAEAERIEAAAEKVVRGVAEWARLEAASQQHLAASKAVLAKINEASSRAAAPAKTEPAAPVPAAPPPPPTAKPAAPAVEPAAPVEEPAAAEEPKEAKAGSPPVEAAAPAVETKPAAETAENSAAAKPPRKRAPKKPAEPAPPPAEPAPTEQVALEFSQTAADEAAPAVALSADGATRLLVTAYIGIGNRLFIRGDGPGLSWDRGVPLQFVSIGKWRWETSDASAPVAFKLYKNDEIECAALEARSLEPGNQLEVRAVFG